MKNSDMPAMPLDNVSESDIVRGYLNDYTGLTKLEHFAGLAMQGILADDLKPLCTARQLAKISVENARALLAELENEQ
jgi:hypothetical protein